MSAKSKAQRPAKKAAYCPSCQRVYRTAPLNRSCPTDGRGLIGLGDPLPSSGISLLPVSFTVSVAVFVGLGIAAF